MIRVAIVDDHPLILSGIRQSIQGMPDANLIATWKNAQEVKDNYLLDKPDVMLLDLNLPDGDGIKLCKDLLALAPQARIIILTTFDQLAIVKSAMNAGASGYLLKTVSVDELHKAIQGVYQGLNYLQEELKAQLADAALGKQKVHQDFRPQLTKREKEVLRLIADEFTSTEIAEKLFLSVKTIETHRANLMHKLQARNSAGLIKVALDKGLLDR